MSACPSLKLEEPSKMPTSHSANEATTKAVSLLHEQNAKYPILLLETIIV